MKDLKNIKLYLFDMDGTLYLGNRLYDFTNELLYNIKSRGGTIISKSSVGSELKRNIPIL